MKRFGMITALGATALAAFVACADSDEGNPPVTPGEDGGTLPDADPPKDAGVDVADVGVDAAPRECSKESFCHTTLPPNQKLRGVWIDGAGITWAVSEEGAVLRHDGNAWSVATTLTGALWSIWGSGPNDIWIGGDQGLFHGTGATSATLTFEEVATPGRKTPIMSVWGTSKDDVWATGGINDFPLVGRVLHFEPDTNGVPAWSLVEASTDPLWFQRGFGTQANGAWVIGKYNNRTTFNRETWLLHRAPGAQSFEREPLPNDPAMPDRPGTLDDLYDAKSAPDGKTVWILGKTNGGVAALLTGTSADGVTFAWSFGVTSVRTDPLFNSVEGTGPNDVWLLGNYGRLKHFDGTTWKQSLLAVTKYPVTSAFYAMAGQSSDGWFVGDGIALHRDPSKGQQ